MSKQLNTEENAIKLKNIILEIESKATKEITSSRGLTSNQSRGFIDSTAVNDILSALNKLCGDEE